ncbi:Methylated-DNA-[protein]-cysteine S-methyltransferase DNA binding protein [Gemmatirosa kalamazoonensis]|uniref:Methylated-DNA-[protein]-cysteine S-methyltransferase DNA binding protein n=1 Tax=Gemmatirosa kalamazoonensis TaxID=861299 RepID=W0RGM5_9BACT|nr:MGMT family protein [Gemmatirosa kalamazoonensis]AHG89587.1 Methylated-DNA-[protein]-cysteine S-methyltransferase DNA binding protein [Gemmatirosa kalamazoonensis]
MRRDPSGSWSRIYRVVARIPAGRVATYGQVATLAGLPGHARLVGYALAGLPDGSPLPWQRVINAAGRVSTRRDGPGGTVLQRLRLEQEGVRFDARGRVNFEEFGWRPRVRAKRR